MGKVRKHTDSEFSTKLSNDTSKAKNWLNLWLK
jgi:hypothetical protein